MKTYKTKTLNDALYGTMKILRKNHANSITFLRTNWEQIAPEWARELRPYLIKNDVLIMQTNSKQALILQYREIELLKIVHTIIGNTVAHIKITKL